MPKVPEYNQQTKATTAAPTPYTPIGTLNSQNAYLSRIAFVQTAQALQGFAQRHYEKAARQNISEAALAVDAVGRKARYGDPDSEMPGYLTLKGEAPATERQDYESFINREITEIRDGLPNEDQRAQFDTRTASLRNNLATDMQRHEYGEREKLNAATYEGSMALHRKEATSVAMNSESYASEIGEGLAEIEEFWRLQYGLGPDDPVTEDVQTIIDSKQATWQSGVHAEAVGSLIDQSARNPAVLEQAEALFAAEKDEMSEQQVGRLTKALDTARTNRSIGSAVNTVMEPMVDANGVATPIVDPVTGYISAEGRRAVRERVAKAPEDIRLRVKREVDAMESDANEQHRTWQSEKYDLVAAKVRAGTQVTDLSPSDTEGLNERHIAGLYSIEDSTANRTGAGKKVPANPLWWSENWGKLSREEKKRRGSDPAFRDLADANMSDADNRRFLQEADELIDEERTGQTGSQMTFESHFRSVASQYGVTEKDDLRYGGIREFAASLVERMEFENDGKPLTTEERSGALNRAFIMIRDEEFGRDVDAGYLGQAKALTFDDEEDLYVPYEDIPEDMLTDMLAFDGTLEDPLEPGISDLEATSRKTEIQFAFPDYALARKGVTPRAMHVEATAARAIRTAMDPDKVPFPLSKNDAEFVVKVLREKGIPITFETITKGADAWRAAQSAAVQNQLQQRGSED